MNQINHVDFFYPICKTRNMKWFDLQYSDVHENILTKKKKGQKSGKSQ